MLKEPGQWIVRFPHPVFLEGAVWETRQLDLYDDEYLLVEPEYEKKQNKNAVIVQ